MKAGKHIPAPAPSPRAFTGISRRNHPLTSICVFPIIWRSVHQSYILAVVSPQIQCQKRHVGRDLLRQSDEIWYCEKLLSRVAGSIRLMAASLVQKSDYAALS